MNIEIFRIQLFSSPLESFETISSRRTAHSHSKTPSETELDDNKHSAKITEYLQGETSVEPNTKPTDNTQQISLQIQKFLLLTYLLDKYKTCRIVTFL